MSEDNIKKPTPPESFRYLWNKAQPIRYAWNGNIKYTPINLNCLLVQNGNDWGYFTRNGEWMEGTIKIADPTFCRWVTSQLYVGEADLRQPVK